MSRVLKWGLVTFAVLVVLDCMGLGFVAQSIAVLAVGWTLFLYRVLPQVAVNWGGVATALISLPLFVAGLHGFLRWLYAAWNAVKPPGLKDAQGLEAPDSGAQSAAAGSHGWRFRWTFAVAMVTVLMFVAGIAMVGLIHQLAWLARSPEPLVGSMRESTLRSAAHNSGREIGLGLHNYADRSDAQGSFPPGGIADRHGRMLHGWQTLILPYIEQTVLFNRIDRSRSWTAPENAAAFKTKVPAYQIVPPRYMPDVTPEGLAISDFSGNVHVLGPGPAKKLSEITDGLSYTILAGEVTQNRKPWGSPTNWRDPGEGLNQSPTGFGGRWREGDTIFVMADGSVRTLNVNTAPNVLKALATPAGGEDVAEPFD